MPRRERVTATTPTIRDRLLRVSYESLPLTAALWLTLFFLAPLSFVVVYSVANATFGGVQLGFTLTNFRQSVSGLYLSVFEHTLFFAVVGSLACAALALPVAYTLARKVGRFRNVLLVVLLIPFLTSFLIRTFSWQILLAPNGPLQFALNTVHLHHGILDILDTNTAVLIGIVYGYLPLMTIPLYVAFERIPPSVIEASKDLHGGRIRTFYNVTLPLARPGVVAAALLTFVPMTGEFVIPALLGGNRGVFTGGLIYSEFLDSQNFPLGSAMSVLLLAVLGVAVLVLIKASKGFDVVTS